MQSIQKTQKPEVQLLNLMQDMSSENMWLKFSSEKDSKLLISQIESIVLIITKKMETLRDDVLNEKSANNLLNQEKDNNVQMFENLKEDKDRLVQNENEMKDKIDQMVSEIKGF